MIENSTWMELTNEVCALARIRKIRTAAEFDSDPSTLNPPQLSAKTYVQWCHNYQTIRTKAWFNSRVLDIGIDPITANATFAIDTGLSAEALIPHSFYNNTGGSSFNRPLEVWSLAQFDRLYPDKTVISTGPPQAVVLIPPLDTDVSRVFRIRAFPNPDANYTLQFQGHINAYKLTLATDKILWPYEYQHVISAFAWELLERGLGEGKQGEIMMLAQKAANDVMLVGRVPSDIRKGLKMFKMGDLRSRSHIASPTDPTNQVPLGPYWP